MTVLLPPATIGIIGGGQLGRMMAISAKQMGFRIAVLDPDKEGPAAQVADHVIAAPYSDMEAAKALADISDRITYEFENIDSTVLEWLEQNGKLVQSASLLQLTQHRVKEKRAIEKSGCQVASYRAVATMADLDDGLAALGFPAVLKTCTGGYDGKGQHVIRSAEDIKDAGELLTKGDCVLEQWVPFQAEVSVIVTRSTDGEVQTFPVAENKHIHNILAVTQVPAQFDQTVLDHAEQLARQLARELKLVGTLAVEMFVTEDEQLLINELAPRPHNSGHFSIEGCETSQFEQHIRAICGWPLGSTVLRQPSAMINVLGQHLPHVLEGVKTFSPHAHLHLYGKEEARAQRKMGHVTITAHCLDTVHKEAAALEDALYRQENGG
ncbi:5-(carboxyamino)imidazole ribonucleotide synthase [Bacillaceae bacterium SIJ1]|uniref:5-(carboxyamino)imidazole ribonucleotide synthase n=1 Tax=Litoribacterium kuwaitense TaxID=1398745 RepID=UPI0013EBEF15|nr:5-(carboxyamino)imidazole ribonucleotide synthase [Litoribacterium kuwaitense]NGP46066.1 5-(carboxyamino)imidazole ribonucleotide synthase [Litoribacterium kuwaitense]